MKTNTAIAPTGSFLLLKVVSIVLFASCNGPDRSSDLLAETLSDYICQDKCDRAYFKPFTSHTIHLEVEPNGLMSQIFYYVDPALLSSDPIILSEPVEITGKIVSKSKNSAFSESSKRDKSARLGDIVALPTVNNIPFLTLQSPTVKTAVSPDDQFSLTVLSGQSYSFVLNPTGAYDRAPFYFNAGLIDSPEQFEFNLTKKPPFLTGRVVAQDRLISANKKEGPMIAKVMQGNRLVSSTAIIGTDGHFLLEISNPLVFEDEMPIILSIEPLDTESALPRIERKLKLEDLRSHFDIGDIDLGSFNDPIDATIEIRGMDDSVIGNACLFLKAKMGSGESFVKKYADPSGTTKFNRLYEGSYDIAVVPSADSVFAMKLVKSVKFDKKKEKILTITLPKRQEFNAVVFAPTNIPVSGAQIEFSRIGEVGNFATEDIYDDMLFKVIANTDEQGNICNRQYGYSARTNGECSNLLLDEGRYMAHIIPPAGSQLAHKWMMIDFPKENDLVIKLDQPQVLSGQIVSPDRQTPLKHAFITIYLAEANIHNQPKVIGNAITDERGFFKAFVSQP